MSLAYESADLILKLYDLRREETMRQARLWYRVQFHPSSAQDVIDTLRGEHSAYYRMVTSYWNMAASLVANGAIDHKMFMDANGEEAVNVFVKVEPYLGELRAKLDLQSEAGTYLQHLEEFVVRIPNAKAMLAEIRERFTRAQVGKKEG